MSQSDPYVIELTDIPSVEPNSSDEMFLALPRVFVIYQVSPITEGPFGFVLLEMKNCRAIHGGGPNDEALRNHRCYEYGLQAYTLQEVVNSPWIEEHARYQHRDGKTNLMPPEMRHFVFALKEGAIDCLATGYKMHGPFNSMRDACNAALEISGR